jgi:hypothetical protein
MEKNLRLKVVHYRKKLNIDKKPKVKEGKIIGGVGCVYMCMWGGGGAIRDDRQLMYRPVYNTFIRKKTPGWQLNPPPPPNHSFSKTIDWLSLV